MHGAPVWARAATVAAGPVFNFILSILIFTGFFMVQGVATDLPTVGSVKPMPVAADALQPGDRIVSLAGQPTPSFDAFGEITDLLPPSPTVAYADRARRTADHRRGAVSVPAGGRWRAAQFGRDGGRDWSGAT